MPKMKGNQPIGFLLERTTRVMKLQFHKAFKNLGVDMTPEQWVIMDALRQNNHQAQKELGDSSYKDAPTISRILNVLEKKKWITRKVAKVDRRILIISLTRKGEKIIDTVLEEVKRLRKQGWENLNDQDYKGFTKVLNQIFENYSKR